MFEELTERPLAALRNGNVGYTLTLIPPNQLQAFEAKILQQRKEYFALYDCLYKVLLDYQFLLSASLGPLFGHVEQ